MSSTIEKICERALSLSEQELARRIGAATSLSLRSGTLARVADFCELLESGHVIVTLDFEGGGGKGVFAVSRKNAIRLAGKLLMASREDLNRSIGSEAYEQEYRYAFDEVVKCFIGTFLQGLQHHTRRCAAVTCGKQEIFSTRDGGMLLEQLHSEQHYFLVRTGLSLAGVQQEDILLLLPAFLVVSGSQLKQAGSSGARESAEIRPHTGHPQQRPKAVENPLADLGTMLESASFEGLMQRWVTEVDRDLTAMFGIQVKLAGVPRQSVDEEQIWIRSAGRTLLVTAYRLEGLISGTIAVVGFSQDAMRIGALIGRSGEPGDTPGHEDRFDSNYEDGFHELCSIVLNIGAEWLTETTSAALWVDRQRSVLVDPGAGRPALTQMLEDRSYVMITMNLAGESWPGGCLHVLFPSLLAEQLELATQDLERMGMPSREPSRRPSGAGPSARSDSVVNTGAHTGGRILLVNASEHGLKGVRDALDQEILEYEQIESSSEILQDKLDGEHSCVILVMDSADEIALSALIKINSLSEKPLVAVASQWTQSQIIKALRYGASDILLAPVTGDELRDKLKGLGGSTPEATAGDEVIAPSDLLSPSS